MSRIVLHRGTVRRRPSRHSTATTSLLEAAAGVLLALAIRELWRVGRKPQWDPRRPLPRQPSSGTIKAARKALLGDLALRDSGLRLIAGARDSIELLGWVSSRPERARAARLVAEAIAPVRLVNGLLVRGEDDDPSPTNLDHPGRATA